MKPPLRPERRSRNIGTAKQGHGQDNELVIPDRGVRDLRSFFERLPGARVIVRDGLRFVVEPTQAGFVHPCTPDDVVEVLHHVPLEDRSGLDLVVLRQPKKKERILAPAWGRLVWAGQFGSQRGAAIVLEALEPGSTMTWGRHLRPDDAVELERLKALGYVVRSDRRRHQMTHTLEAARSTMLHHTLLHEVGHFRDYLEKVQRPCERDERLDWNALWERFHARGQEKEVYAHRYADALRAQLLERRVIPFPRRDDPASLARDGLATAWFSLAA